MSQNANIAFNFLPDFGVIPCLSRGLAKNNKSMSMFVLFSGHFVNLAFFRNWGDKPYTKAVKQDVLSQFFKGTAIYL